MKYAMLILGALLLGIALVSTPAARAGAPAQAGSTPAAGGTGTAGPQNAPGLPGANGTPIRPPGTPGSQGNGAPPGNGAGGTGVGSSGANAPQPAAAGTPPVNLVGHEPNEAVGDFLPVCLIVGLLVAGAGAFISTRLDREKAARIRGRDAPRVR